jgi:hypothetical protein
MTLNCERDMRAFPAEVNSAFALHVLAFGFRVILKTSCFMTGNDPITHLCIVLKDQMKFEADVFYGHLLRFEAPSLRTFFSLPNPL